MEAEVLAHMVVEAKSLLNHKTKAAVMLPGAAVAATVAEGFNYSQETKLSRRRESERRGESY